MPGQHSTKARTVRGIDDALWEQAGLFAAAYGTDRSTIIRALLLWWTCHPGAELPERPERTP